MYVLCQSYARNANRRTRKRSKSAPGGDFLARRVGISAPPCLRRVRSLEEAGYIKGYRALLDEKALGCEVTAFAMVHLASQAEATSRPSRHSCAASRWCANAGCCQAKSISS